jgi:transposase
MAAMAARNHDPAMRAFLQRLVHNGKPKMVTIVAVMRKIVVIANARVRTIDRHATEQMTITVERQGDGLLAR